jgi:hypothetical protein
LEIEPGEIARTPTKGHMGLVTEFDFTVRMKKTSVYFFVGLCSNSLFNPYACCAPGDLNFLNLQVFDDRGVHGDRNNATDHNVLGGSLDIDIHRLIASGELGASELTSEYMNSTLLHSWLSCFTISPFTAEAAQY